MSVRNYHSIMEGILKLPVCTLLTTGRTGTDFLQSLLDSHPQVLTFNGPLFLNTFWENSVCVAAGKFDLEDLIDEFIGKYIYKLKSKYDIEERKDQLGDDYNQSLDINTEQFKAEIIQLLDGRVVNSKNFLIAIYGAYAISLSQDIEKKTLLFHHLHHIEQLDKYLKDFPDSKIISMTRDPRANFVSGIEHWRKVDTNTNNEHFLYYYIRRILADSSVLERYGNEYVVIRIEDLWSETILKKLCTWLNIEYNECMKKSTWGGLRWGGDRLSLKRNQEPGFSAEMLKNRWEEKLSFFDKYIFNYIMNYRLQHYDYHYRRIGWFDSWILPFLIVFPLKYEIGLFSFTYLKECFYRKEFRKIVSNGFFYFRRVFLFFKYYLMTLKGEEFRQPFLELDRNISSDS